MYHLYGFVDDNQLTGNLDPLFCNNIDAFLEWLYLAVDCEGSDPQVVCSCCCSCGNDDDFCF
jgi:hypothetical protein